MGRGMFDALKSFIMGHGAAERDSPVMDERLATAALLVHTIAIDGAIAGRSARPCCRR